MQFSFLGPSFTVERYQHILETKPEFKYMGAILFGSTMLQKSLRYVTIAYLNIG